MGDGSYSCDTLSIACDAKDQDVVDDVLQNIKDVFGLEAHTRLIGSNKGCCEVRVSCKPLKPIFDRLGILKRRGSDGNVLRDVKVPDCIFRSPESVVKAFLSALFESDGFNGYNTPRIIFFSKHKQFINDVQLLLLACGVVSRNTTNKRRNGKGFVYDANELSLNGWRAYEFNQKIGFISSRKRSRTQMPKTRLALSNEFVTKVVEIERDGYEKTYNLTIDPIHEFDANGIHTHNCPEEAFLSSGNCIFNLNTINERKEQLRDKRIPFEDKGYFLYNLDFDHYTHERKLTDIRWVSDYKNGYITLYKKCVNRMPYVLSIDPAGDGSDFTAMQVLDNRTGDEVCILHKNGMNSFEIACQAYCLGKMYNTALIGAETNFAPEVMSHLNEFGYLNLYLTTNEKTNLEYRVDKKLGFRTTTITRPYLIDMLLHYINENAHLINDYATLSEAENFVRVYKTIDGRTRQKEQANEGAHDDLLMSLGIALYMRDSGQQTFELLPEEENEVKELTEFDRIFGTDNFFNNREEDFMSYDDIY